FGFDAAARALRFARQRVEPALERREAARERFGFARSAPRGRALHARLGLGGQAAILTTACARPSAARRAPWVPRWHRSPHLFYFSHPFRPFQSPSAARDAESRHRHSDWSAACPCLLAAARCPAKAWPCPPPGRGCQAPYRWTRQAAPVRTRKNLKSSEKQWAVAYIPFDKHGRAEFISKLSSRCNA